MLLPAYYLLLGRRLLLVVVVAPPARPAPASHVPKTRPAERARKRGETQQQQHIAAEACGRSRAAVRRIVAHRLALPARARPPMVARHAPPCHRTTCPPPPPVPVPYPARAPNPQCDKPKHLPVGPRATGTGRRKKKCNPSAALRQLPCSGERKLPDNDGARSTRGWSAPRPSRRASPRHLADTSGR